MIVGRNTEVTKIDQSGAVAWSRSVGAAVAGVAGTSSGVVVVAASTSAGPALLLLEPNGADGPVRPLPGGSDGVLFEVGTGRRIGAVTGASGCAATVTALDVDGANRWSRPVATAECGGSDLSVNAVTVTTAGVVVVGGALRGSVDLGLGRLDPRQTDDSSPRSVRDGRAVIPSRRPSLSTRLRVNRPIQSFLKTPPRRRNVRRTRLAACTMLPRDVKSALAVRPFGTLFVSPSREGSRAPFEVRPCRARSRPGLLSCLLVRERP